ncbi:Coiled-coil domain-containing protein 47 [Dirofilaria immitis]|nr:Coiled-coil domain-containing protein 47 [Dirofilaria immitis]
MAVCPTEEFADVMMWSSLTNNLLTIWMIISIQLLRYSNGAAEMDNEFAEFEDMEVENMNDDDDDNDDNEFIDEDEFSIPIKRLIRKRLNQKHRHSLDSPMFSNSGTGPFSFELGIISNGSFSVSSFGSLYIKLHFRSYQNRKIANKWFMDVTPLLEEQFTLVGDDGTSEDLREGHMHKETDAVYTVWCSGRVGCQGMLITLKLLKRQDLIHVIMNLIRPKLDKVIIRIDVDSNEMDSFVFAIGQRKSVIKAAKEKMDLSLFTVERKGVDKLGLPSSIVIYAEMFEAVNAIIDSAILSVFRKYEDSIDYFHFSDQYSGYKPSDGESLTRLPETSRVLFFAFKMSSSTAEIDALLRMADKKRQSVQEAFLKTTHQARQEAAQARREEKTRERKQRLLEEEDPEKQRRLEKLEQKRDMKMRQPKMKQLRVK